MKLYSLRKTDSRGWVWHYERDVTEENAPRWLCCYKQDEPSIEFRVAPTKPRLPRHLVTPTKCPH